MAEVKGLRQALKNMQRLPSMVAPKGGGPINRALFRAAREWQKHAQDNAASLGPGVHNDRTGQRRLKDSIIRRRDQNPEEDGHYARVFVGDHPDAFWGLFVELGTEKQKARPFLRPALDQAGDRPIQIFARQLTRDIERIVERLPK